MARERDLRDHYFKEAKRAGYRSRAAYKLTELDDKRSLLRRGDRVLDCGCAPGSWLQVAAERIGPRGRVVGIDLNPIHRPEAETVTVLVGDLTEVPAETLTAPIDGQSFDVVLSDMAPRTTGDRTIDHHGSIRLCHAVLDRCADVLRPGGTVVLKVLEGEAYPELLERVRRLFDTAKGAKPKASRAMSTEIYLIGTGLRGDAAGAEAAARDATASEAGEDAVARPPAPRGGPSRGWGSS